MTGTGAGRFVLMLSVCLALGGCQQGTDVLPSNPSTAAAKTDAMDKASAPAEGSTVRVAGYVMHLPATWENVQAPNSLVLATRFAGEGDGKKKVGEILWGELSGTIERESTEMAASAARHSGAVDQLEAGAFSTNQGAKGVFLLHSINAVDPSYGSPQAFYSIYLPVSGSAGCVTFKLRCGISELKLLRKDFEDMLKGAVREETPAKE